MSVFVVNVRPDGEEPLEAPTMDFKPDKKPEKAKPSYEGKGETTKTDAKGEAPMAPPPSVFGKKEG